MNTKAQRTTTTIGIDAPPKVEHASVSQTLARWRKSRQATPSPHWFTASGPFTLSAGKYLVACRGFSAYVRIAGIQ